MVAYWVSFRCDVGPLPQSIAGGPLTFGFVVAGFAATQRNMLLPIRRSAIIKRLTEIGAQSYLSDYLMHAVWSGLTLSIVSVVGFFLGKNATLWNLWAVAVAFMVALIVGITLRNELIMSRIMKQYLNERG